METSPFPFFGPLRAEQVEGRHDLIADLTARISARRVTALLGPRRYGKTSLLRRVAADLATGGGTVLWFDLYEVQSMADLAMRLDDGMSAVGSEIGTTLRTIAIGANLNLGLIRLNLTGPSAQRPDPNAVVHGQMQALLELSRRTPLVLIFDEFSSLSTVDGAAGLLRTHLQNHYQEIGLVFAGSEPSMMLGMFTDQNQPFYSQAELIYIAPFSALEVQEIVAAGFERTDRRSGDIPSRIYGLTGGHPQRAMQMADMVWQLTDPGTTAEVTIWESALESVRRAVAGGLERLFSSFRGPERAVLRIVASGGSIFGSAAALLDLANGSAQHARDALLDHGHLRKQDDSRLELTDPLMADWLRQTLPV